MLILELVASTKSLLHSAAVQYCCCARAAAEIHVLGGCFCHQQCCFFIQGEAMQDILCHSLRETESKNSEFFKGHSVQTMCFLHLSFETAVSRLNFL